MDFEICKFDSESNLFNLFGIQFGSSSAELFRLGSSANHLARSENESSRLFRVSDSHDDSSESLWIVFGILSLEGDVSQVQSALKIRSRNDVLEFGFRKVLNSLFLNRDDSGADLMGRSTAVCTFGVIVGGGVSMPIWLLNLSDRGHRWLVYQAWPPLNPLQLTPGKGCLSLHDVVGHRSVASPDGLWSWAVS